MSKTPEQHTLSAGPFQNEAAVFFGWRLPKDEGSGPRVGPRKSGHGAAAMTAVSPAGAPGSSEARPDLAAFVQAQAGTPVLPPGPMLELHSLENDSDSDAWERLTVASQKTYVTAASAGTVHVDVLQAGSLPTVTEVPGDVSTTARVTFAATMTAEALAASMAGRYLSPHRVTPQVMEIQAWINRNERLQTCRCAEATGTQ